MLYYYYFSSKIIYFQEYGGIEPRKTLRNRNIYPRLDDFQVYDKSLSPVRNIRKSPSTPVETFGSSGEDETDFKKKEDQTSKFLRSFPHEQFPTHTPHILECADLRELKSTTPAPPSKSEDNKFCYAILSIILIIAIGLTVCNKLFSQATVITNDDIIDCSELLALDKKFPNQDKKLFKSLLVGIEGAFNGKPPEPSVISLFSTDENIINNIVHEVLRVAKQCSNQSEDPLSLKKDQLSNKLVTDYKDELTRRKIMIINYLNEASASEVQYLHSFCDTENPLVRKSIIFITLKVPQTPIGKPVEYITKYLENHWSSLADNIRGPLITRIIDQTFFLEP